MDLEEPVRDDANSKAIILTNEVASRRANNTNHIVTQPIAMEILINIIAKISEIIQYLNYIFSDLRWSFINLAPHMRMRRQIK